jgi:hypothetical protein
MKSAKNQAKQVQFEIAELLNVQNEQQSVAAKFSQSQRPLSQHTSQMLDKHHAAYGGTASQIAPRENVAAASQDPFTQT